MHTASHPMNDTSVAVVQLRETIIRSPKANQCICSHEI